MSFVIDESRVEELLKSSEPKYTVSVAPGGEAFGDHPCSYNFDYTGVSGTVAVAPPTASPEAVGYLMSIRRKIEESGARLKSAEALNEEIDRMRRR